MLNIIDLVMFIVIAVVIATLAYLVLYLAIKNSKLRQNLKQFTVDKFILLSKLDELLKVNESESVEKTDGFLKFVSESRDWAFEYIEKFQVALIEYREAHRAGNQDEILEAYDNLINLLPEDTK